jgi:probable phosphoglycerate mutase
MTRLVLVRHGETTWHAENRYAGSTDVPLTDRGIAQAGELAQWARMVALDAVWTSPLARARVTATLSAEACGASITVDERLREIDFGRAEGLTAAEMTARFPAERRAFLQDPVVHHLPGGEDPVAAESRFVAAVRDADARHAGGRVLIVAHTTVIRLALCRLLGLPLARYRTVFPDVGNCTLTELEVDGGAAAVIRFNVPIHPLGAVGERQGRPA